MSELEDIINELIHFRDDRNWKQFHDSKNLASAISIEAAELNELFLWKNIDESEQVNKEKLKDELADVLSYCFLLAQKHGLNVKEIILEKILKNAARYPIEKSKGNAIKYDQP